MQVNELKLLIIKCMTQKRSFYKAKKKQLAPRNASQYSPSVNETAFKKCREKIN